MLTTDQKEQFNEIFGEISKSLDITRTQYDTAVASYKFAGEWLSRPESPLAPYKPEILPQGSFLLGTMIRPEHEDDDLDVDLVCRLDGKQQSWTQYDVKKIVGDRLKAHDTLRRMLDNEGRRCWTILHRESARFHMDILPAIVANNFTVLLEKAMSATDLSNVAGLAIRITDKLAANYNSSTDPANWLKSNPFGYAAWFKTKTSRNLLKAFALKEVVRPVPDYETKKLPLQRVIQLLKRHRDRMFNGDEDKPISIIITTLAALAYQGQPDIIDALIGIVNGIENFIEDRYDFNLQRIVKWVANPVNMEENFADKWTGKNKKQENFYNWLDRIKADLTSFSSQRGLYLQESLTASFGKDTTNAAFSNMGEKAMNLRESGLLKMAAGTGILGRTGRTDVSHHNNYGVNE